MPLDFEITKTKFEELTKQINADTGGSKTPEEVASGCVPFQSFSFDGECDMPGPHNVASILTLRFM